MIGTKSYIAKVLRNTFFYGAVFAAVVFIKCVLFNWFAFDQIVASSLWKAPAAFWGFYLPKIAISIGVASFVLLCNRKWVAIVLSAVIDLWIIANLMYMRSYGMVIDAFSITMVGNLSGFESSLPLYMRWADMIFPLLSICIAFIPYTRIDFKQKLIFTSLGVSVAIVLGYIGQYSYLCSQDRGTDFCWSFFSRDARQTMYGMELAYPTQQSSILHTIGYDISDLFVYITEKHHPYKISKEDSKVIDQFYNKDADNTPKTLAGPLVVVIVESFEDWVFQPNTMPYLSTFCEKHNVLYANKVHSQVRGGMSADGQMLINTGLLPTLEGAACYRFPRNIYPGIMQYITGKSATLVPHSVDVWNQTHMSQAYVYDTTIQVSPIDSILFQQVLDYLHEGYQNIQVLTISTHSPFDEEAAKSSYEPPEKVSKLKEDYYKAFHVLDAGFGVLLEAVDTDSILKDATIVITGDHIIWPEPTFCPLIVYSPRMNNTIHYSDVCYQMDIYPTLVDLLGIEPCWQGFGKSLLSSRERRISEEQAYDLSDKMHRANYFAHVDDNIPHYIAHAGGIIDGYSYTNSLEAVNNAITNGIQYVELDLALTSDDSLVASHAWIGCEDIVGEAERPSYASFMNYKVYGRFTPLNIARIDSIMQANPKLHIVTDKISEYETITRYFGKYKNRMVIECFRDEDYYQLKDAGYEVFRSEYPPTKKGVLKQALKSSYRDYIIKNRVFEGSDRQSFSALYGDTFAVYTCSDRQSADSLFDKEKRIKYVYIDDVNH